MNEPDKLLNYATSDGRHIQFTSERQILKTHGKHVSIAQDLTSN